MNCCCNHVNTLHEEGTGPCSSEGCNCRMFETNPQQASGMPPIEKQTRAACGCLQLLFKDGRNAAIWCHAHAMEAIAQGLSMVAQAVKRFSEIELSQIAMRIQAENANLLRRPPPGPRRVE